MAHVNTLSQATHPIVEANPMKINRWHVEEKKFLHATNSYFIEMNLIQNV